MKSFSSVFLVFFLSGAVAVATENLNRARQLVQAGDATAARALLANAARTNSNNVDALSEYAEFLDRFGDPGARDAYAKVIAAVGSGDSARRNALATRLASLDLLAGDRAAAERHLAGTGLSLGSAKDSLQSARYGTITIPGPLRGFRRMAAISSDSDHEDILAAVARNVVTNGYQASRSNEALEQTEYLKLVYRYLGQAREIEKLAGDTKKIKIENCESPIAGELLKILGYRIRGGCGSEVVLETVNASRAFLTTDSGFPLAGLEQALRTNRPFELDYTPTRIPVRFDAEYWLSGQKEKQSGEFIDVFLSDPSLCRLYLGFAKLDAETAEDVRKAIPVQRIKAFAHVLDFFGGMLEIRNGKVTYPGNAASAKMWEELVGASPDSGAAFIEKLLAKDDGWLCSLYDALLRVQGPVRDYLTEPARMKRFYTAVRGRVTSPGPARPVFRANADMMLLTTRLWIKDGKLHVPGTVDVWKNLFINHPHGKYDGKLTKLAVGWKDGDDVLEALFALCRKAVENEPLKIFMALSDLDRRRARPLEAATVDRLAREYHNYGSQYAIFNDAPSLTDATILKFIDTAAAILKVKDQMHRANTAGTAQGLVSLWQILVRQGSIPVAKADPTLNELLTPFAAIRDDYSIFDAGRSGVKMLLAATGAPADTPSHERMLDLLAGAAEPQDRDSHLLLVQEMMRVLEAQRVLPLTVLFDLADHLDGLSRGEKLNTALVNRLATRIAEIQLPRSALTGVEKNSFSFGYYAEKHVESQRRVNMRAVVEKAQGNADRLKEARGLLTPFLRDTIIALNYAHYAPPGAQILFTNPLFVRGHDFLGTQGNIATWKATEIAGTGWPANAGGRLVGSMSCLPYAIAEAEQNFLIPSQTQALIWGDLVPQMIQSAKVPRWWNVSPALMHWAGLHMRYGRELIAGAAIHPDRRTAVLSALSAQAPPARVRDVSGLLSAGEVSAALDDVTPSELFAIAAESVAKGDGPLAAEIQRMSAESPQALSYAAVSRAFGTPKPTLANSYQPELLGLRTFPTLMGYSSRILAESWESNTLYWAALADEVHMMPSQLNLMVPEWTQKVVERIFASHLEDWPALLRSLRIVGDDVRGQARKQLAARTAESGN